MKEIEITFQTVCNAVKHQWKWMLSITLIFSLLGLGAGALYAKKGASPAAGSAETLETVEFSKILYDTEYYGSCSAHLFACYNDALGYVQQLSAESTLTKAQKKTLKTLTEELNGFYKEVLTPLAQRFAIPDAIYIPDGLTAESIQKYEGQLRTAQYDLMVSSAAAEVVKSMDAPDVDNAASLAAYQTLLEAAARYGSDQKNVQMNTVILNQLHNQLDRIEKNSRQLDAQMKDAVQRLNALGRRIGQAAAEIAGENHLNICVGRDITNGDALLLTIDHTHSAATAQDAFAILTLFCVLTGICVGGFFAVCRESRMENPSRTKDKEGQK